MTVGKSTRYALYAAVEMTRAGDALTTVTAVAQRYRIPEGALAKVFQHLVRAGLAAGTRGVGGGYRLARPASRITVLDVMEVFERPRTRGACVLVDRGGTCELSPACRVQWLFDEVDELVQGTYASVTLATLARHQPTRARNRLVPSPTT